MAAFVPPELTGLWRRELITAPGLRDDSTRVLWLQTRSWYVDIRVPADRPAARGVGFDGYEDAELVALARIEGFAGELAVANGVCAWRRDLDHQPPAATPDEGRYTLAGEVMIEDGVHLDYQETWRRTAQSAAPLLAFRLEDDPAERKGLLVVGGDHMLEFVSRSGPAPASGASLAEAVGQELELGRRATAEALLSTRIRYATRQAAGWRTELSSLPWLEGEPMFPHGARWDASEGVLRSTDGEGRWRLLDASPGAEPGSLAW